MNASVRPGSSAFSSSLSGSPHLAYRNGQLYLEEVYLNDLAQTYGTPLFVYSKAHMLHALAA